MLCITKKKCTSKFSSLITDCSHKCYLIQNGYAIRCFWIARCKKNKKISIFFNSNL